jgi:hypothetical protein
MLPTRGVPVTDGGTVLSGASAPGVAPAPTTAAVASDVLSTTPPGPEAVTTMRIVQPSSAATGTYIRSVAPAMSAQSPLASHRRHW